MKHKFFLGVLLIFSFSVSSQPATWCYNTEIRVSHPLNSHANTMKYIENYATFNGRSSLKHTRAYYISSKAILFIDSFFKKYNTSGNTIYKGVTLNFTIPGYQTNYEQLNDNQQFIKILPIKNSTTCANCLEGDFAAFQNFYYSIQDHDLFPSDIINKGQICPGNCDDSVKLWSNSQFAYNRLGINPDIRNEDKILLYTETAFKQDTARYRKNSVHGVKLSGKQTRSVFFKPETFHYLAEFINAKGGTYPLIGIYFSNYTMLMPANVVRGHHSKNQTTLGFIPLKLIEGKYQPDICAYIEYFESKKFIKGAKPVVENHGSLCPNDCSTQ